MAKKGLGVREQRQRAVKREIKNLEKKGFNTSLATEGKSIEELSKSKKAYERFLDRRKVAKERAKIEKEVSKIKERYKESRRVFEEKRKEKRKISLKELEKRGREERKKAREEQERIHKQILEEERRKAQEEEEWKHYEETSDKFGMEFDDEFQLKEYLTNMLTLNMEGVDRGLINRVRDIIYDADIDTLDRITDFFPQWEAFKEFYTANDEDVMNSNSIEEKTEVLNELINYIGE